MPSRRSKAPKNAPSTPRKLKQQTLFGYVAPSSSPSGSSPISQQIKSPIAAMSKGKKKKGAPKPPVILSGEDSDSGSDVNKVRFEPTLIDLSSEPDDEKESPRKPDRKKRRLRRGRASSEDSEQAVAQGKRDSQEHADPPVERKRSRKGKGKANATINPDSDSEEVAPRKRKLVKGIRPPSPEENEDLLDEVDEDQIIENRFRTRDKKSAFQKNLEKLKRKKRGLASESSESPAEEEASENEETFTPFQGAKPDDGEGHDDQSADVEAGPDDSWIVEDEDDVAPVELPVSFSINTHQDLSHHFKIICQLFVHLAVRPTKERHSFMERTIKEDQYFSVPLQVVRRKLSGMRDSLVASSVWKPEFKTLLEKYPGMEMGRLDFAVPICDACHLGGRMSTFYARLSGDAYDKLSFEPLPDSDDSDSEPEDERRERLQFNLGRFCAKRTRVFHEFTHWEYGLYTSLLREVDELRATNGRRGFVRVAFAGGVEPPDDLGDADGIMEWLDQRGIINMEWQRVKEMMAGARQLEFAPKGDDSIE